METVTETVTDITGTRKTIVLSMVGVVVVVALVSTFVPTAREYAVTIAKTLLSAVPSFIK